ncbi:hypothetical protein BpHYR1_015881 [Brachionus plicatilis]|uniref:Uncharacterized protein n=1 Tax=Brachionus plicatilis TaxID=10195 RepID=A0A3M7QW55_BRAPC|nr:hypothetical protein BpHYR1_015881 [Brachionus plicatilis]
MVQILMYPSNTFFKIFTFNKKITFLTVTLFFHACSNSFDSLLSFTSMIDEIEQTTQKFCLILKIYFGCLVKKIELKYYQATKFFFSTNLKYKI